MPRVLVHGNDPPLEAALAEHVGLELVRGAGAGADAEAFLSLGPTPRLRPLADVNPDEWNERFGIWAQQPFWAFQAWLRRALERGQGGRWVAVTSTLGALPFPGGGPDGACAVTLHTLVRIAAAEYGPQGIRANAIAAGWRAGMIPDGLDPVLARADTPSGRLTSNDDLAGMIVWLLSDEADQVNGEILRLDGGYTITGGSQPDPRTQ